jgi:F-type H+-transporting ATPase subunit delta
MAELATIARPYAEAVFGLADKSGGLERWAQLLAALARVVEHPQVEAVIANPNLQPDQLYGVIVALSKADLPVDAQNFVRLLIANDRLGLLPDIHRQFVELKNAREGVVKAAIATAFPLDDAQLKSLVADLERRFKRRIEPEVIVDEDLIGGARIAVGDEVIDGSVRGKLEGLAVALKR